MCGGSPKAPKPQPRLPEAPVAPDTGRRGGSAGDADQRRRRAASGQAAGSTLLTGPRGVTTGAQTAVKDLLGG